MIARLVHSSRGAPLQDGSADATSEHPYDADARLSKLNGQLHTPVALGDFSFKSRPGDLTEFDRVLLSPAGHKLGEDLELVQDRFLPHSFQLFSLSILSFDAIQSEPLKAWLN